MAVTVPTSKPKTIFYKMVTVPKVKTTPQNAATVTSYKAFTTGLNRLGATLNSMLVVNKQMYEALSQNLKLKVKQNEEEKKDFDAEKTKKGKGGQLSKLASNFMSTIVPVLGDFFENLMGLFGTIMRAIFTQAILRWIANPANQEKLTVIWNALVNFFKFLWEFVSSNIGKTLSGLSDMLNSNLSFWDRLKGFGTFLVGFGSLLLGFVFLKKPKLLLDGVKFVLKTIWDSVTGLIKILRGRKKGVTPDLPSGKPGKPGAAAPAAGGTPGGKPRGRAGAIMKGIAGVSMIAAPLVIGGMLGGGESEFQKSVTGDTSGGQPGPTPPSDDAPRLKDGGIVTRPTKAVIGERGPEARIPLTGPTPGDNAKRMALSGIQPLPSGGGIGGGVDRKKAKSLSDLYIAPFKGVGAGILANISNVVGQMPGAQQLTPVIGDIVAPIANSFGVPPSLVKKLTGQSKSKGVQTNKDQRSSKLGSQFGKGKVSNVTGTKFVRKGDNTVLGLLTDLVGAGQVIVNKLGGQKTEETKPSPTPGIDTTPGVGSKEDSADTGSASAVEAAKQGKGSQDITKGTVGASDNTKAGQTSDSRQNFSSTNKDANRHNLPFKGPDGVTNYEAKLNVTNGDYEVWKHNGLLGWQQLDISGDKNTLQKQKAFNQVRAFYIKHAQQQGLALNYITQDDVKKRQELVKKYDAEAKAKGVDSSAGYKNKPPKKAMGGWISGPMSGYPVSLDGGGSTSFIGHGTEWVGFKKAAGGVADSSAFVIPYDTPATQNNKGLTNSRFRQAKSGGYALPSFSVGGQLEKKEKREDKAGGDGRPPSKFAAGGKAILEGAKKIVGYGKGSGNECANSTRAALRAAGHSAAGKVTSKGDLDTPKGSTYSKGAGYAASFAGSDMGSVINSPGALQAGDIVLWKGGNGYGPGEITHVGIKGEGNDLWHHGRAAGFRKASMYTSYGGQQFAAGIRLDGKAGENIGSGGQTTTDANSPAAGGDAEAKSKEDILKSMADAIDKLNVQLGLTPPPSLQSPPTEVYVNSKTGEVMINDPSKTPGAKPDEWVKKKVAELKPKEKEQLDKILTKNSVNAAGDQAGAQLNKIGAGTTAAAFGGTTSLAPAPKTTDVTSATTAVNAEKDKLKQTSKAAAAVAAGSLATQASATTKVVAPATNAPPAPIILPGPSRNLDIAALNPRTSIVAYQIAGVY